MHRTGLLHHWLQQNHDRLAQKAGFPQAALNEIHGAWGECVVSCLVLRYNPSCMCVLLPSLIRCVSRRGQQEPCADDGRGPSPRPVCLGGSLGGAWYLLAVVVPSPRGCVPIAAPYGSTKAHGILYGSTKGFVSYGGFTHVGFPLRTSVSLPTLHLPAFPFPSATHSVEVHRT
jgi:hypothetical protein